MRNILCCDVLIIVSLCGSNVKNEQMNEGYN